ncbi:MAG: hypothetical protein ACRDPJ_21535 [Nocardioidaceae bacterium]
MRHRAPRQFSSFLRLRRGVATCLSGRGFAALNPRALVYVVASTLVLAAGGAWASTSLSDDNDPRAGRGEASMAVEKLETSPPSRSLGRAELPSPTTGDGPPNTPRVPRPSGDSKSPSATSTPTESVTSSVPDPSDVVPSTGSVPDPTAGSSTSGASQPADATAPQTTITKAPSSHEADLFVFTASEPATFTCSLDGQAFQDCGSPMKYSSLDAGWHTLEVRATDLQGNSDPSPAEWRWHSKGK